MTRAPRHPHPEAPTDHDIDMEVDLVDGDIAAQSVDAIVNAAGTSLEMGSGVAGALRRAAGEELNEAAVERGPIDLGAVAVTDAFALDATYVIHAAAMPHYGDGEARAASIECATHNALVRADRLKCEAIALPALGCGTAGFALRDGARIIADELRTFEPESLATARFVVYGNDAFDSVRPILATDD